MPRSSVYSWHQKSEICYKARISLINASVITVIIEEITERSFHITSKHFTKKPPKVAL